jgi:hypothetical protein
MRTDSEFFNPTAPTAPKSYRRMPLGPFLALALLLPAMIVIGNFVIGALTPITSWFVDDISLIDPVWRLVQGQRLGTDFHDPIGFGFFQVAAMLWRWLGPHYYVLRASVDLFALVIVLCSYLVATRQLRHAPGLATLFCITVAFEASGPSIYGFGSYFGLALSYDRLLMSGLLVLFMQSFANDLETESRRGYIDHFITAFLLNLLFLIKISGLIIGFTIVVGGYIVRGHYSRNFPAIPLVLLLLVVMLVIDFIITGATLSAVVQDYRLAAQARTDSYSVFDALRFACQIRVLGVVVLMTIYSVSRPGSERVGSLWRGLLIIAFFWLCQVVLNMSNGTYVRDLIFLAPAAAVAVATWNGYDTMAFWDSLCSRLHPRRLHGLSAREVIPPLAIALVLVPEALASFRAVQLDYLISLGVAKPIAVTARKGVTFDVLPEDSYGAALALSLNRAIRELEAIGASKEKIANVDYMNPFPALLLAPAPKGVSVFWAFGFNVPVGYKPSWQEVVGDACIITEPKQPALKHPALAAENYERLVGAVEPHLATAFTLVYQDEWWKIWKYSGDCGA